MGRERLHPFSAQARRVAVYPDRPWHRVIIPISACSRCCSRKRCPSPSGLSVPRNRAHVRRVRSAGDDSHFACALPFAPLLSRIRDAAAMTTPGHGELEALAGTFGFSPDDGPVSRALPLAPAAFSHSQFAECALSRAGHTHRQNVLTACRPGVEEWSSCRYIDTTNSARDRTSWRAAIVRRERQVALQAWHSFCLFLAVRSTLG